MLHSARCTARAAGLPSGTSRLKPFRCWSVEAHPSCVQRLPRPYAPSSSSSVQRSFTSSPSPRDIAAPKQERKKRRSLAIDVNDVTGATPASILAHRIPTNSKEFDRYVAARDQDGKLMSMNSTLSPAIKHLQYLTFEDADSAGREALELSTAYLAAAALRSKFGGKLLSGSASSASRGTSSSGFTCECLLLDTDLQPDRSSSVEPTAADRHEAVLNLIREQAVAQAMDDAALHDLEKRMEAIVSLSLPIADDVVDLAQARQIFEGNPLALERVDTLSRRNPDKMVRIIRVGEFVDVGPPLGEGAVVGNTKALKNFKLTGWSRATWTPTEASTRELLSTQSLLRLRGVSFSQPADLKAHIASASLAAASDHRIIGRSQSLFLTHTSSPGTPFFLPHGMRIARKMERVVRDLYDWYRYDEVQSPQVFRKSLWERSGHWDNYREDMFAVEGYKEQEARSSCAAHGHTLEGDADIFGLKPMNCPGHCLIFANETRSYRDLPIRYAEFSPLHRNEPSGSLSGLTRVRRFHQDDAHVFCEPSQVGSEISSMLSMLSSAYSTFGFPTYELVLSTRPPKFVGSVEEWDRAEEALRDALNSTGKPWTLNEADGAFYGPKIDVRLVDAAGRRHQTATIQLDFQLPQRFDLQYALPGKKDRGACTSTDASATSSDSADTNIQLPATHARPVLIHRAILGSVERFMAILIENTAGWWPFWLSPRQAIILPVGGSQEVTAYAERVRQLLSLGSETATGLRVGPTPPVRPEQVFHVDLDHTSESLSKMVRTAQLARYNFILVVGEREAKEQTVRVRAREDASAPKAVADAVQRLVDSGRPTLTKDMGEWKVNDLRKLFCQLDSNHW